ncbi:Bug family tripartite tricarboxylate transporter substrate binding protein [Virgibacillus necropolis]|uniref:Bug family tripartite tricarboxylate transporter substrate binding protein n=1 Tax=Virgibacillus necropolis TaxID=163877 RepID=UPI001374765D|nr:tripartite tricarboxylate transporter substrate binding protein [Virgibacillus necropolis]
MYKKITIIVLLTLVLGACSNFSSGSEKGKASDYPTKPIEVIVPFAAGGSTDVAARTIASVAQKYLPNGQTLVISNKPGGGGAVGLTELLSAKPDGYTIALASAGSISYQPLYGNTSYSKDSFQSITMVNTVPQLFVVNADSPWETFDEWLKYAKENPNEFKYGTAGTGIPSHVAMEALNIAAGIKTTNVPYEGAAPTVTALLGGHIDGAIIQPTDVKSHVKSGELRVLANVGETKMKGFEDVPFLTDKGIDVAVDVFAGFIGPKDLPEDIVDILDEAFKKTIEDPELTEKFEKLGIIPKYGNPNDFQKVITDTFESSKTVVEKAGLLD